MGRSDEYRDSLQGLPVEQWKDYLIEHSGLPGPRGNLELAMAVAEMAPESLIHAWSGSEDEYLALCGAIGLGRLAAGNPEASNRLRELAADSRWRVREGVAMGLQRLGDADPRLLIDTCRAWLADGSWLVQRAVIAGLCEPRLLRGRLPAVVLDILDEVTQRLAAASTDERRSDGFRVLRQALGYCWSVAVAATPVPGFDRFERWSEVDDRDVRWVVRENLRKNRIKRADADRWLRLTSLVGRA